MLEMLEGVVEENAACQMATVAPSGQVGNYLLLTLKSLVYTVYQR